MNVGDLMLLDPQAVDEPVGFDYTAFLAEIGPTETLIDSEWTVTGKDAALVASGSSIVTGNKQTQAKLTGGTRGRKYVVTNHFTTSSGVQDDRSFTVLSEPT